MKSLSFLEVICEFKPNIQKPLIRAYYNSRNHENIDAMGELDHHTANK